MRPWPFPAKTCLKTQVCWDHVSALPQNPIEVRARVHRSTQTESRTLTGASNPDGQQPMPGHSDGMDIDPLSLEAVQDFLRAVRFLAGPLAAFSAIHCTARSMVTASGSVSFGIVALTLPHFTYGP